MFPGLQRSLSQASRTLRSRPPRPIAALVKYRSLEAAEIDDDQKGAERASMIGIGEVEQHPRALGQPIPHTRRRTQSSKQNTSSPLLVEDGSERIAKERRSTRGRDQGISRGSVPKLPQVSNKASRSTQGRVSRVSGSRTQSAAGKYPNGDSSRNKLSNSGGSRPGAYPSGDNVTDGAQVSRAVRRNEERDTSSSHESKFLKIGTKQDMNKQGGNAAAQFLNDGTSTRTSPQMTPRVPSPASALLPWGNLDKLQEKKGVDSERRNSITNREKLDRLIGRTRYGGNPNLDRGAQRASRQKKVAPALAKEVQIPPVAVMVSDLGPLLSKKEKDVTRTLRRLGETAVTSKSMIEPDTAELVALELGLRTVRLKAREWDVKRTQVTEESFDDLSPRPPVVSLMGHVDHGKTTLLDSLRKASDRVAGTEAAGITQKIGAFSVTVKDSAVTFFDTPGHAAFKSMRESTSRLTDVVVIVVAADDGVKSQTIEVLNLLKDFPNIAPVVAVTKVDRPGVNVDKALDKISRELLQHEVVTEPYGGQTPILPVSGMTGDGLNELLEALLLQAEMMELRADDKAPGEGIVVDSSVLKGRGGVADVLVSWGSLKTGDIMVAGMEYGRVRSMLGSDGKVVKQAGASQPVRVVGFKALPKMGDQLVVVESEEQARAIIAERLRKQEIERSAEQESELKKTRAREERERRLKLNAQRAVQERERAIYRARVTARTAREKGNSDDKAAAEAEAAQVEAESWIARAQEAERKANNPWENDGDEGGPKAFNAVFKADGFGMLEAMSQVLTEIPQDEVCLNVIRTGVGPVTQSDVGAAATAEAPIFAFNVKVIGPEVKVLAQRQGVQIHTHNVIYRFLEDIRAAMSTCLPVKIVESPVGEGEILEVFDTTGKNGESIKVAGTSVTTGKLSRQYSFRVIRGEQVLREGLTVFSMRRFKDRVNEVDKGKECGIALEGFGDLQQGDMIQCYSTEEVKRQL